MALTEARVSTRKTEDVGLTHLVDAPQPAEWSITATAAAGAVASFSKAAVTGKSHYIQAISADFDAAHIDLLIYSANGIVRHQVHNQRDLLLGNSPIKCAVATAFVASLNVTSFNGAVTAYGYTA